MHFLGKLLIWITLPWCAGLGFMALRGEDGNVVSALLIIALFSWIPWITGRLLLMIRGHLRRFG